MMSIDPFLRNLVVFERREVFAPDFLEKDEVSLGAADDCLRKGEISKAFAEARQISQISVRDELYERIGERLVASGDLSQAEEVASQTWSLSIRDRLLWQIFNARLVLGRLNESEETALKISSAPDRNHAIGKIIQAWLDQGKSAEAKQLLKYLPSVLSLGEMGGFVIDAELAKQQLTDAIGTCGIAPSEESAQKIVEHIAKQARPSQALLDNIEKSADQYLSLFPRLHKMILEALLDLFKHLGNREHCDRLTKKVAALDVSADHKSRRFSRVIHETFQSPSSSKGSGSASASLVKKKPVIKPISPLKRPENWAGVGTSALLAVSGVSVVPACAVGLGAAVVTRMLKAAGLWVAHGIDSARKKTVGAAVGTWERFQQFGYKCDAFLDQAGYLK